MNIHSYNRLFLSQCIHMHYNNSLCKNRKRTVIAMYIRMPDDIKHPVSPGISLYTMIKIQMFCKSLCIFICTKIIQFHLKN